MASAIDAHTSLAYIDTQLLNADLRAIVDDLIAAECSNSELTADELLAQKCPQLQEAYNHSKFNSKYSELLRAEQQRIIDKQLYQTQNKAAAFTDISHYSNNSSSNESSTLSSDNHAKASFQYQQQRVTGIELLRAYGASCWRTAAEQTQLNRDAINTAVNNTRSSIEDVNRKRKYEQSRIASELASSQQRWFEFVLKNYELEMVVNDLQSQINNKRQNTEAAAAEATAVAAAATAAQ